MLKKTVPNPHTPSLTRHQVSKFTEEKCGATETSDRKDDLSLLDNLKEDEVLIAIYAVATEIPAAPALVHNPNDKLGETSSAESPKKRFFCTVPFCAHEKATKFGYANKEDLTKHELAKHTEGGSGRHQCPFCNKKYDSKRSLNKHLHRKHNGKGVKPTFKYQCPTCNARFRTKKACDEHVQEQACTPISGVGQVRKREQTTGATKTSKRKKSASFSLLDDVEVDDAPLALLDEFGLDMDLFLHYETFPYHYSAPPEWRDGCDGAWSDDEIPEI